MYEACLFSLNFDTRASSHSGEINHILYPKFRSWDSFRVKITISEPNICSLDMFGISCAVLLMSMRPMKRVCECVSAQQLCGLVWHFPPHRSAVAVPLKHCWAVTTLQSEPPRAKIFWLKSSWQRLFVWCPLICAAKLRFFNFYQIERETKKIQIIIGHRKIW